MTTPTARRATALFPRPVRAKRRCSAGVRQCARQHGEKGRRFSNVGSVSHNVTLASSATLLCHPTVCRESTRAEAAEGRTRTL